MSILVKKIPKNDAENNNQNSVAEFTKNKWAIVTVISSLFIYLSSQFFAIILFGIYLKLAGKSFDDFDQIASGVMGQFGLGVIIDVIVLAQLKFALSTAKQKFENIGWRAPKWGDLGYALAGFAVYFTVYASILSFIEKSIPQIDIDQAQQIGYESANKTNELALVFISLVVLAPIVEELLFRGYLYINLRKSIGIYKSAIITSIIFAAAHLQLGSGVPPLWVAAIDTGLLSLVLVYLRQKTGGLMAPIILHMIKNSLAFVALFIVS